LSYVLEALKKADAERERGSIPGLHAQPLPPPVATPDERQPMRPWMGVTAGVALGLIAALAWHWTREAPPDRVATVAKGTSVVPEADQAAGEPNSRTDEPGLEKRSAEAASAPAAVAGPRREPGPPTQARETRQPVLAPALPLAAPVAPVATPVQKVQATTATGAASVAATQPGAAASAGTSALPAVYAFSQLPEDVRRELPALTFGGSMYSATPSERMLIVNGQVLHEGDTAAPGVVLERIKLKSAVLRYKNVRYEVGF
jgi:general secretion pathway protein B